MQPSFHNKRAKRAMQIAHTDYDRLDGVMDKTLNVIFAIAIHRGPASIHQITFIHKDCSRKKSFKDCQKIEILFVQVF